MRTYLEVEEVKALEEAAQCLRDRLLVRLLSMLDCRVSELTALGVGDVDFSRGTATIQHLKARMKLSCPSCSARLGRGHAFCPKCGAKVEGATAQEQQHRRMRTLPIDSDTLEMVAAYIRSGGPKAKRGKTLLFGISRGQAWRIVRDCARRAGLPALTHPESGIVHGVSPHRLRDAFAVHAVKADDSGDGLRLLQEHLGHVSFNTTARYRKVSGQEHREWYNRIWNIPKDSLTDNKKDPGL